MHHVKGLTFWVILGIFRGEYTARVKEICNSVKIKEGRKRTAHCITPSHLS